MAGGIVVYRVGPFEFHPATRRLFRGQRQIPLSDAQAAILDRVLSSVGQVVPPDALIHAAWGNTAVNDASLRRPSDAFDRRTPKDARAPSI